MNPINHLHYVDGNGRWGLKYKNNRNAAHKAGIQTVKQLSKIYKSKRNI